MKRYLFAGVLSVSILGSCKKDFNSNQNGAPELFSASSNTKEITAFTGTDEFVPNEILIRFKPGSTVTGRANALNRIAGRLKEHVLTDAMKQAGDAEGFQVVSVPNGVLQAIEKLQEMVDVEIAEPNYILRHIPLAQEDQGNDPYYIGTAVPNDHLWGMHGELTYWYYHNGSRAGEAWSGASEKTSAGIQYLLPSQKGSETVYVGVIDEGLQYDHEDLISIDPTTGDVTKRQVANRLEVAGSPNVDDDNNGYVDDLYGWNFITNTNNVYEGPADDHGTHVAGTIGAIGNNGKGVAGVCWNISMVSAKFLGANGGTTDQAIKAIDYITNLKYYPDGKTLRYNIVATNNSWGGGLKSTLLQNAITRSEEKGILFIAAAGNDGSNNDKKLSYPSCYPNANIISVGSIKPDGSRSSFSNYGAKTVDLFAPGNYIWSTTPRGYEKFSGTSMATPHVTGAVALFAAANGLNNVTKTQAQDIKAAILNSARPSKYIKGLCLTSSRLDVHSAWQRKNNTGLVAD